MAEIQRPILAVGSLSELRSESFQAAFESSGGILNDRSEAGALYAIFDAQARAVSTINANLNGMVDAATINLLRALGITLDNGGRAYVDLTIILVGTFTETFTIPRFQVARSGILFYLDGAVVVPAGVSQVQMGARAMVYGTAGNVSAGPRVGDWTIIDRPPSVLRVVSTQPATGGRTPERIEDVKNRPVPIWGDEVLIRKRDFERAMRAYLGENAPVLAMMRMGSDKLGNQPGNVHLFALNPDGAVLSNTQLAGLLQYIEDRCPLVDVHAASMDVIDLTATVRIVIETATDADLIAGRIWFAMNTYLSPAIATPGETVYIKNLDRLVGGIRGIERVQSVEVGIDEASQTAYNYRMPELWSVPRLMKLRVIPIVDEAILDARIYLR